MKRSLLFAVTLAVSLALPSFAQTQIPAPRGWTTQTKPNGATTFTPPDLKAGEKFSITVYDAAPLGGQTPEAWLRKFGGSVGTKPGNLAAPLAIEMKEGKVASGIGAYIGPNGAQLGVVFIGSALDGAKIQVMRTLFSDAALFTRYAERQSEIVASMMRRAASASKPHENAPADLPSDLPEGMKVGGDLVPGVYAGTQVKAGMYGTRSSLGLRVYIYPNGEYRICDQNDEDFDLGGPVVGKIKVNRARGTLDIDEFFALSNDNFKPDRTYCFYGRNAEGEPVIFGRSSAGATTDNGFTKLIWQGPPTGRPSKSTEDAPAKAAQDKLNRIKVIVAPGKGVSNDQIAAIIHDYHESLATVFLVGGVTSLRTDIFDRSYLLLKDGSVYEDLLIAPDQFDIRASRQKEPNKWGLWKSEGGKIQISMGGQAYETLGGTKAIAGTSATRLSGRYVTASPSRGDITSVWGVSFTRQGRFIKDALAKDEDDSAVFTLSKGKNSNSPGDRQGTYSIQGYALTLRYDNGRVARMPFFFIDAAHKKLWFEGNQVVDESSH